MLMSSKEIIYLKTKQRGLSVCSHGNYIMMKVMDGYKLKLMNSAETVHQHLLSYPLIILLYSQCTCCDELWKFLAHLENSSLTLCALESMLQRGTDCRRQLMFGRLRLTTGKKAITSGNCRLYLCRICPKACGCVECALEMPDELLLIANALFMWFTKPSLK